MSNSSIEEDDLGPPQFESTRLDDTVNALDLGGKEDTTRVGSPIEWSERSDDELDEDVQMIDFNLTLLDSERSESVDGEGRERNQENNNDGTFIIGPVLDVVVPNAVLALYRNPNFMRINPLVAPDDYCGIGAVRANLLKTVWPWFFVEITYRRFYGIMDIVSLLHCVTVTEPAVFIGQNAHPVDLKTFFCLDKNREHTPSHVFQRIMVVSLGVCISNVRSAFASENGEINDVAFDQIIKHTGRFTIDNIFMVGGKRFRMVEIEEAPVDFDATQWSHSLEENNEREADETEDDFSVETRDAASTDGESGSTEEVEDAEKSEDQEKTTSGSISSLHQQPDKREDGDGCHSTDDSHMPNSQKEEQAATPTATGRGDLPKKTGRGDAEKKAQGPEVEKSGDERYEAPRTRAAARREAHQLNHDKKYS